MAVSFKKQAFFEKGIAYAEFFDPANDNLLGYSQVVSNFGLNGTMNNGEIEGGVGNQLIMAIPDTARLNVTAQTADTDLNSMALPIGGTVVGNGVIETVIGVSATGDTLQLANAVAPLGGQNGAVCYVLTSSGADKAAVEAVSGVAHTITDGTIDDFTAVSGNTYCVKYFITNSSAMQLDIPALFAPKVVRAHFATNLYAKQAGGDALESSVVGIRHYYFPYYFFSAGLQGTASQTAPGTTDLSGMCLTYEQALESGSCAAAGAQKYGFIVDEMLGANSSTANIQGIYFIGLGSGASVAAAGTLVLPVKYDVNGSLVNVSDWNAVTFSSAAEATAKFDDAHENIVKGVAAGSTTITVSVTNSRTGATYTDTIPITVT